MTSLCEQFERLANVLVLVAAALLDENGLVREFDLIERLLEQPVLVAIVPRPRQLMLIENAEFHGRSRAFFAGQIV
jgi:hypothetical protein